MATVVIAVEVVAAVVLVLAFNLCVCAEVEKRQEQKDIPFFVKWKEEVNENQNVFIRKFLMKSFYFIPTIVALVSWTRNKLKNILEESLG